VAEILWGVVDFLTFDDNHHRPATRRDVIRVVSVSVIVAILIVAFIWWQNRQHGASVARGELA
jgi:hypothetical protein